MPKASSPVRLDAALMEQAATQGALMRRSAAQQVEFWAAIGRQVADQMTPRDLLEFSIGAIEVRPQPVDTQAIDPDQLLVDVERDTAGGELTQALLSTGVRYQASHRFPEMLEQVHPNGEVVQGRFEAGQFTPVEDHGVGNSAAKNSNAESMGNSNTGAD